METTASTTSTEARSAISRPVLMRYYRPLASYLLACVLIYIGLWTTPPRNIPPNAFDESIWLSHSVCADAVLTSHYPETCRDINLQSLDHSAGAKYMIAAARWFAGIPADAVKYNYTSDLKVIPPTDPNIRVAVVRFMIGLSSLTLILLFAILKRSFGSIMALTTLAIFVLTPFWQFMLSTVMAEPSLCFFSILAWAGMLWLTQLLTSEPAKPLPVLLIAATFLGASMGAAVGVKPNAALLAVGFIAVLLCFGPQLRQQWLLLIWLAAVALVAAAACVVIDNPFLWGTNILERLQMFGVFRAVLLFGMTKGHILDVPSSIRQTLSNSLLPPYFNILPLVLGLPLCLLGLWAGFRQPNVMARTSWIWLLSIGLGNSMVNPVNVIAMQWDRHFIYTILAIHIFTGIGLGLLIQSFLHRRWPFALSQDRFSIFSLPDRRVGTSAKVAACVSICLAGLIVAVVGVATIRGAAERKLWQAYILADAPDVQIDILNQILEQNPQARRLFNDEQWLPNPAGEPLTQVLQHYFEQYHQTYNPGMLRALATTNRLLQSLTTDSDLRARLAYDMQQLGQPLALRNRSMIQVGAFTNNLPPEWVSKDKANIDIQYLLNSDIVARTAVYVAEDGDYQLTVSGMNYPLPPILIGVQVDHSLVGTLQYDRGDSSWSTVSVSARLTRGSHEVQFQLLNDLIDPTTGIDRNGAIRGLVVAPTTASNVCQTSGDQPIEAATCTTGWPPVVLNQLHPNAIVGVSAPVPALYDLECLLSSAVQNLNTVRIRIDDQPLGEIRARMPSASQDVSNSLPLSPMYLPAGKHEIHLEYVPVPNSTSQNTDITLDKLVLTPRYPNDMILTPSKLGSIDPRFITLSKDTKITGSWRDYRFGYSFYNIRIFGSSEQSNHARFAVSIDDIPIGVTTLDAQGIPEAPLAIELANGTPHSITISPIDMMDSAKAFIYAVQIEPYNGPTIFAASSMRWEKQYNSNVSSDASIIHLPQKVNLTKSVDIGESGVYSVTVRSRVPQSLSAQPLLLLSVDGWQTDRSELANESGWSDQMFSAYLIAGQHELQIDWQADNTANDRIDIMYVTLQKQKPI
jgi:hypothetical protein